jgi:hypothetical protein
MPAVAWVTLVATALIVALVALALLRVVINLKQTSDTLGAVIGGVRAIAEKTSTVPARLTSVNATLKPVKDWTDTV